MLSIPTASTLKWHAYTVGVQQYFSCLWSHSSLMGNWAGMSPTEDWLSSRYQLMFGFCIFPVHWCAKASALCARAWARLEARCSHHQLRSRRSSEALHTWPFLPKSSFSTATHLAPGFHDHSYDYWSNNAHQRLVWFHWGVAFLTLASGRTWEWHTHLQKTILEPPPSKLAKTLTFKPKKILNPWNHLSYPSKERETQNVLCSNL